MSPSPDSIHRFKMEPASSIPEILRKIRKVSSWSGVPAGWPVKCSCSYTYSSWASLCWPLKFEGVPCLHQVRHTV
ncbi:hypothetical protein AALO_G00148990 [Alosa alosa]|uniref:Uncharacterized protein n=1 Tax=Alosa alosa TaxID=278164 RepID=A0AAV6GHW6_9TELE|nr:hypothetical protein AALO_G00148990 [Alosa alosa]